MPGREPIVHAGLEFRVSPDFLPRRLNLWPFYFESNNPSFRAHIARVSDSPEWEIWGGGTDDYMVFRAKFADDTHIDYSFAVPDLEIGQSATVKLENIYTPHPGHTKIMLLELTGGSNDWATLYSYRVWLEEQLWIWAFYPVGGIVVGVLTSLLVRELFG